MLDDARRRTRDDGVTNVEYLHADAQVHQFADGFFDVAISVFGAMFFADPVAAFANICQGLRPGGQLAFLSWQPFEGNEWIAMVFDALSAGRDLPTPSQGSPGTFGLADADAVYSLRDAGFVDATLVSIEEPMWMGDSAGETWGFVSEMGLVRGLCECLDATARARALAELRRSIDERQTADGVLLGSAAWLIRAYQP